MRLPPPEHYKLYRGLMLISNNVSALFGYFLEDSRMDFDSLLRMSNKASLQNQLQNHYARNPGESNETFSRVIKWCLL